MDDEGLLAVLHEAADAVAAALGSLVDWGPSGDRSEQYHSDVVADEAALAVLEGAGLAVLSEESGVHHPDRPVMVVIDPVDGSTNASRGLPWYATSLCALDADGPLAAVVVNQASGVRYEATRGGGARCDDRPIAPSGCTDLSLAFVGLSGHTGRDLGWRQLRISERPPSTCAPWPPATSTPTWTWGPVSMPRGTTWVVFSCARRQVL